jgi:hypothetical protein
MERFRALPGEFFSLDAALHHLSLLPTMEESKRKSFVHLFKGGGVLGRSPDSFVATNETPSLRSVFLKV